MFYKVCYVTKLPSPFFIKISTMKISKSMNLCEDTRVPCSIKQILISDLKEKKNNINYIESIISNAERH